MLQEREINVTASVADCAVGALLLLVFMYTDTHTHTERQTHTMTDRTTNHNLLQCSLHSHLAKIITALSFNCRISESTTTESFSANKLMDLREKEIRVRPIIQEHLGQPHNSPTQLKFNKIKHGVCPMHLYS